MLTTATPESRCHGCGHTLDAVRGPGGRPPRAGDISICIDCGAVHIFNADGTIRIPTPEESKKLECLQGVILTRKMLPIYRAEIGMRAGHA